MQDRLNVRCMQGRERYMAVEREMHVLDLGKSINIPSSDLDIFICYSSNNFSSFCLVFYFQIEKLNQESIQHPTPLLKLLFAWSKNSRFFPLLSRKPVEKPDLSIMSCVFACLRVPSVSEDVVAMVMDMTDNLLATSQSQVGDEESDLLECGSELT